MRKIIKKHLSKTSDLNVFNLNILNQLTIFILLIILSIILSSAFTSALGISPAKKTITFVPNKTITFDLNIINSELNSFDITLSSSESLSDIIFFEQKTVSVSSSDYRTPIKIIMNFPSQMKPGVINGFIILTPIIKDSDDKMFNVYISPRLPISIRVPKEGKYVEIDLTVLDVDEGTPVPVFIEFDNMGSEDVNKAGASINIYSPENKLIAEMETEEISVNVDDFKKAQAFPAPIIRKGEYSAEVDAYYDEVKTSFNTSFRLGTPKLRIKKLITNKLISNEINKVEFVVYNDWNKKVNVKGFIEINNHKNKVEMPDFTLLPYEKTTIMGFADLKSISEGEHNLSINLIYDNKIDPNNYVIEVVEASMVRPSTWFSGSRLAWFIIILIIILLLIVLLIIMIIKKKE